MISALAYLQYQSFLNRTTYRFKRLKQPKYLIGAAFGFVYLYFYFYRFLFGGGRQPWSGTLSSPVNLLAFQHLGALVLLVIVFVAWLFPNQRAALVFTEAEVAFLFPAPITRRALIQYKLLRSQIRIFFTTFLIVLFTHRSGHPWFRAAGWWLVLSTLNLHFLGSSFARTMLLDRGVSTRTRRWVVVILAVAIVVGALVWVKRTIPALDFATVHGWDDIRDYILRVLGAGPMFYVLTPFRLVLRPYFAQDATSFLLALAPALLVLAAHYAWVVSSDTAFEEASVEASQKAAERMARARAGNWQMARGKLKRKGAPFALRPVGPAPVALLWKNLISVGQAFTLRLLLRLAIIAVVLSAFAMSQTHERGGWLPVIGSLSAILVFWSLLIGPRMLRQDLRQDLLLADVLKTFPMRGWQIVLGELLAPVAVLAAFQWLLLIVAAGFLLHVGTGAGPWVLSTAVAAAMVLPTVDLVLVLTLNAAVLLFPAWMQIGKDAPRGIEATGQRVIFLVIQWLVLLVALLPAAVAFLIIYIPLDMAFSPAAAIPLSSLAAALVVAGESALGIMLLGRVFERFDLSKELGA